MRAKHNLILFVVFIAILASTFYPATANASLPTGLRVQEDSRNLESSQTYEREILVGETHSYQIKVEASQTLHVAVDQRGVDVVVTAFAPDGKKIIRIDSPTDNTGTESVWIVTETAGTYKIEVRTWNKAIAQGKYAIRIVELRASIPEDKNRLLSQAEIQHKYDLAEQPRLISLREEYAKRFSKSLATAMRKQGSIGRAEATGIDKTTLRFITNDKKTTSSFYWMFADAKKDQLLLKGSGFTKIAFNSGGKVDDFVIDLEVIKFDPSMGSASSEIGAALAEAEADVDEEETAPLSQRSAKSRKSKAPASSSSAPAGATAECRDGTYSFSRNRRGTCSHHGGVKRWL